MAMHNCESDAGIDRHVFWRIWRRLHELWEYCHVGNLCETNWKLPPLEKPRGWTYESPMNPSIRSCKKDKKIKKSIHKAIRNLRGPGTPSFFAEKTHLYHFSHLHLFASTGQGISDFVHAVIWLDCWKSSTKLQPHTSVATSQCKVNHFDLEPLGFSITTCISYKKDLKKRSRIFQLNRRSPFSKINTHFLMSPVKFLQTLAHGNISPPQRYPSRSPAFDGVVHVTLPRLVMSDSCIMS